MRNLFDQYTQQENRLTHALVTALYEDRSLLKDFVYWIIKEKISRKLHIIEQQIVGELEETEDEAERRGLPDAWIHDNKDWSLLIESKVSSPLKLSQLRRHVSTAQRCSFSEVQVLAITVSELNTKLPDFVIHRSWSEC